MANYVDFSNAHIECIRGNSLYSSRYLGLYQDFFGILSATEIGPTMANGTVATSIATITSRYVGNITSNGFSVYCDGQFTASGNEFYIRDGFGSPPANQYLAYKVSNIEFEAGDKFSFQINVILTIN